MAAPETRSGDDGPATVDDLIVDRLQSLSDTPLVAYPATSHGTDDYVEYTARDLDRFVDETARQLTWLGLVPEVSHVPPTRQIMYGNYHQTI
jgi:hypothetical protein